MDPVQRAKQIVFGYNENPKEYTDTQAEQIAMIAAQLGLPFRPESKALQKFFFDLADNLAFGALPNEMRPTSRGESVFGETKKEKAAGALSLLGLALPGAAGASIARTGAKTLAKRLPQKTQEALKRINTNRSLEFAVSGAGGLGAVDILEDPAGTPDRALAGALLGGGLGLAGGMLGRSGGGGQGMSRLLMSGNRGLPAAQQRMLLGSGAKRLSGRLGLPGNPPGTLRLGPSQLLNNTDDYLRTAINQAFIR